MGETKITYLKYYFMRNVSIGMVLLFIFLCCSDPVNNDTFEIRSLEGYATTSIGNGVYIGPPKNFTVAKTFSGIQNTKIPASISLNIEKNDFREFEYIFSDEYLRKTDSELKSKRDVIYDGRKIGLYTEIIDNRKKLRKYAMAIDTLNSLYVLKAFHPIEVSSDIPNKIRTSIGSILIKNEELDSDIFKLLSNEEFLTIYSSNGLAKDDNNTILKVQKIKISDNYGFDEVLKGKILELPPNTNCNLDVRFAKKVSNGSTIMCSGISESGESYYLKFWMPLKGSDIIITARGFDIDHQDIEKFVNRELFKSIINF